MDICWPCQLLYSLVKQTALTGHLNNGSQICTATHLNCNHLKQFANIGTRIIAKCQVNSLFSNPLLQQYSHFSSHFCTDVKYIQSDLKMCGLFHLKMGEEGGSRDKFDSLCNLIVLTPTFGRYTMVLILWLLACLAHKNKAWTLIALP